MKGKVVLVCFILLARASSVQCQDFSEEDGDTSIESDLQRDGMTLADSLAPYAYYGHDVHAGPRQVHHGSDNAEPDLIFVPDYGLSRHRRAIEQDNNAEYSGQDNPCDTNSSLCSATGEECVFDDSVSQGYACRCQATYERQGDVCVVIPDSRRVYLTTVLNLFYNNNLANKQSTQFLSLQNQTQEAFSQEFTGLVDYKTLEVIEFRNTEGKTKTVYNVIFTVNVTSNTLERVAGRVLTMEVRGTVQLDGQDISLVGLTGIHASLDQTSTTQDAVDWCSSSDLYTCTDPLRQCQDGGVNPRYTCVCRSGYLAIGDECVDENENQYAMYPYGVEMQDTKLTRSDDDTTAIYIDAGIAVGNTLQHYVYIGINGLISFGTANRGLNFTLYSNLMMFAPYLADITTVDRGDVYYQLHTSRATQPIVFSKADQEIREFMELETFEARQVLVVTWHQVPHRSVSEAQDEVATFQAVVVYDGRTSYCQVYHKQGAMHWPHRPGTPLVIGVSQGQGDAPVQELISNTEQAFPDVDRVLGNTGRRGMYVYSLGSYTSADVLCEDWYQANLQQLSSLQSAVQQLPPCPCSLVSVDDSWNLARQEDGNLDCYRLSYSASVDFAPYNKECCYRRVGNGGQGPLVRDAPYAGALLSVNPEIDMDGYIRNDLDPYRICCFQAGSNYCAKYYYVRPKGNCSSSANFGASASMGDPHIVTMDAFTYTFNGYGEYTLLQGPDFKLQGRTDRVTTENGTIVNATVFSAFAADDGNVRLMVELDTASKTKMLMYVDNAEYTQQFETAEEQKPLNKDRFITLKKRGGALVATFIKGLSLTISVGIKLLNLEVKLNNGYNNRTMGLFGNFNNDPSDDFLLPNGTILPNTSTEQEIFHHFGEEWAVTDSQSVFRYPSRQGPADFRHPDFVPIFLELASGEDRAAAEALCNQSAACIYDFIATKNEGLARETKITKETADQAEENIKNTAPQLTGNATVVVRQGQTLRLQLIGSDAEDGEGVVYRLADSARGDINVDEATGLVTYNATNSSDSLAFYAVDTKQAPSQEISVHVQLCPECGTGQCDYSRPAASQSSQTFLQATCDCPAWWTGDNCQTDFNGCAADPCVPGQDCTDLPPDRHQAEGKAFECSGCPPGYSESGGKCVDVDECGQGGGHQCQQRCVNTEGSYTCACDPGYRPSGDTACQDINECVEKTYDCQQLCVNTDGGYNCSCQEGFDLQPNGTCVQRPDDEALCQNQGCAQGCKVVGGAALCFCRPGYRLQNGSDTACEDEDECLSNVCSHRCNNTAGSFSCSCFAGFALATDRTTCSPCPQLRYGDGCLKTCQCKGRSPDCNPVTGCTCDAGWRGEQCQEDVNECRENPDVCVSSLAVCANTLGSYRCDCLPGYARQAGDSQCTDVDECRPGSGLSTCHSLETCVNTVGSFHCDCLQGYQRNGTNCTDTDECTNGEAGCEQVCINNVGSYRCECNYGFRLNAADRMTCDKVADVCAAALNCTFECTLDSSDNPYCFCQAGYRLTSDLQTCIDINECEEDAGCSDDCVNKPGTFQCTCPVGKRLTNDQRTCVECETGTYGEACSQDCNCGLGASTCNPRTGCVCGSGWTGETCTLDVDECATQAVQQECSALAAHCTNYNGTYACVCPSGYSGNTSNSETCQDIDECQGTPSPCSQLCENSPGSFRCLCDSGFTLNTTTNQCQDDDECALDFTNGCTQQCNNIDGGYRCACDAGFELDNDGFTCNARTTCVNASACATTGNGGCKVDNNTDVCYCNKGYVKDSFHNCNLEERNWCGEAGCGDVCTNVSTVPYFRCSCSPGSQLNSDGRTCRDCPADRWGEECGEECGCDVQNSRLCDSANGTCYCNDGWSGDNCTQDVVECDDAALFSCVNNSACQNTNGSYLCVCEKGYFKLSNGDCSECPDWFYGDCSSACDCDKLNSLSCNKQNGSCSCREGWTGLDCRADVDECQTGPNNCTGVKELCVDTEGSYHCVCEQGYRYNSSGSCVERDECFENSDNCSQTCTNTDGGFTCSCQDGFYGDVYDCQKCPGTMYGTNCSMTCACDFNKTASCDNVNGTCYCLPGWSNLTCADDVDECDASPCQPNANCTNTQGSYECTCHQGYALQANGSCTDVDECEDSNLQQCSQLCRNTPGAYDCYCRPGFTSNGSLCDDVEECATNNGGCDHTCNNTAGSFACSCNDTYVLGRDGLSCIRYLVIRNITVSITVNVIIPNLQDILANQTSQEYLTLKAQLRLQLFDLLKTVAGFQDVIILNISAGSVVTEAEVMYDSGASGVVQEVSSSLASLATTNFTLLNVSGEITDIGVNNLQVLDACSVYQVISPCQAGSRCQVNATSGLPACQLLEDVDDMDLIIGLAVGIPLFFVIAAVIAFVIYVRVSAKRRASLDEDKDNGSQMSGVFATKIATRGGAWLGRRDHYSPDSLSSSSSGNGRKRHAHRSDFRSSPWNNGANGNKGGPSNFSWDFLYNQMAAKDQPFSIRRPRITTSPNPTYDNAQRDSKT